MSGGQPLDYERLELRSPESLGLHDLPPAPLMRAHTEAYAESFRESAHHVGDPEYDEQRAAAEEAARAAIDQEAAHLDEYLQLMAGDNPAVTVLTAGFFEKEILWGPRVLGWQGAFWRFQDPRVFVDRVLQIEAHMHQQPEWAAEVLRQRAAPAIEAGELPEDAIDTWLNDPSARWRAYQTYADIWGDAYREVEAAGEGLSRCREVLEEHFASTEIDETTALDPDETARQEGKEPSLDNDTEELLAEHHRLLTTELVPSQEPIRRLLAQFRPPESPKKVETRLPLDHVGPMGFGVPLTASDTPSPRSKARVWVVPSARVSKKPDDSGQHPLAS